MIARANLTKKWSSVRKDNSSHRNTKARTSSLKGEVSKCLLTFFLFFARPLPPPLGCKDLTIISTVLSFPPLSLFFYTFYLLYISRDALQSINLLYLLSTRFRRLGPRC